MRFDYTEGKVANYLVSAHYETVSDYYYFHYLKAANEVFERIVNNHNPKERIIIALDDLVKDKRKKLKFIV